MNAAPAAPGFDRSRLAQASAPLKAAIAAGDLSGFVTLIWRKGELVEVQTLGMADIEAGEPMTRDTLFRIASMTKPVTSVAALMLLEEGKLSLDDPITKWAAGVCRHAGAEGRHRAARRHLCRAARHHRRGPDDPPRGPRLRLHLHRARSPMPTRTGWARR